MKSIISLFIAVAALALSGCATVPLEPAEVEQQVEKFEITPDKANVYIYRSANVGAALAKTVWINDEYLGTTGHKTYFFTQLDEGTYDFSTESEFSPNHLMMYLEEGKNYYINQRIKMGVFVGGAELREVEEYKAQIHIRPLRLATPYVLESSEDSLEVQQYKR